MPFGSLRTKILEKKATQKQEKSTFGSEKCKNRILLKVNLGKMLCVF